MVSIKIWGGAATRVPAIGQWHTLATRVLEKSPALMVAAMTHFIESLDLSGCNTIVLWQDAANYWRSRVFYGYWGFKVPEAWKVSTELHTFAEGHGKGACDGYFGGLVKWRNTTCLSKAIMTIDELVECWKTKDDELRREQSGRPAARFEVWLPPPRPEVALHSFVPNSLPASIQGSYHWSWRINDQRRRKEGTSLRGRGHMFSVLTGIDCRAGLTSLSPHPGEKTHPVLDVGTAAAGAAASSAAEPADEVGEVGEVGDADVDVDGPQCLPCHVKTWAGWRMSFVVDDPEAREQAGVMPRLIRKQVRLAPIMPKTTGTKRRRSQSAVLEQAIAQAAKARLKTKASEPPSVAPTAPPFTPAPDALELFFDE